MSTKIQLRPICLCNAASMRDSVLFHCLSWREHRYDANVNIKKGGDGSYVSGRQAKYERIGTVFFPTEIFTALYGVALTVAFQQIYNKNRKTGTELFH